MELILADLEMMEKRIANLQKGVKAGDKVAVMEEGVCKKILAALESEKMANSVSFDTDEEKKIAKHLNLLTAKKFIYGLNKRSGGKNLDETDPEAFKKICSEIESYGSRWVVIDAKIEQELSEFEGSERDEMRSAMTEGNHDDGI